MFDTSNLNISTTLIEVVIRSIYLEKVWTLNSTDTVNIYAQLTDPKNM